MTRVSIPIGPGKIPPQPPIAGIRKTNPKRHEAYGRNSIGGSQAIVSLAHKWMKTRRFEGSNVVSSAEPVTPFPKNCGLSKARW